MERQGPDREALAGCVRRHRLGQVCIFYSAESSAGGGKDILMDPGIFECQTSAGYTMDECLRPVRGSECRKNVPGQSRLSEMFSPPADPRGFSEGPAEESEHVEEMLEEYYKERGWDREGIPTEAKLQELGLT
jgi:hypothetical protein